MARELVLILQGVENTRVQTLSTKERSWDFQNLVKKALQQELINLLNF